MIMIIDQHQVPEDDIMAMVIFTMIMIDHHGDDDDDDDDDVSDGKGTLGHNSPGRMRQGSSLSAHCISIIRMRMQIRCRCTNIDKIF